MARVRLCGTGARRPITVVVIRSLRHDESGFTLIEIMVAALVLAVVSIGVLNAVDGSTSSTRIAKARGLSASLAQQDQERLRAMSFSTLAGVNSSRTVNTCGNGPSGCVAYTVASKADWVADSGSQSTCALSGSRSYNLQITSTVTWPGRPSTTPATVEKSLVAAPPGTSGSGLGTLAVRIRQADGVTPVPFIDVTLSGPGNPGVKTTDANGCAVWDYLASGSGYTVSFSKPGFWDNTGVQAVSRAVSIVGQRQTTQNFTYSPGANLDFTFKAVNGGTTYTVQADRVTLQRSSPATPTQTYGTNSVYSGTVHATGLVPGTGYTAYAGDCAAESQSVSPGLVTVPNLQAGVLSTVAVQVPYVGFQVRNKGVYVYSGNARPTVKITTTTAAPCPASVYTQQVKTDGTGRLSFPGLPKGTYKVCAQAYVTVTGKNASKTGWYYQQTTSFSPLNVNSMAVSVPSTPWDITEADTAGTCP